VGTLVTAAARAAAAAAARAAAAAAEMGGVDMVHGKALDLADSARVEAVGQVGQVAAGVELSPAGRVAAAMEGHESDDCW
jgi:hypothetical protein